MKRSRDSQEDEGYSTPEPEVSSEKTSDTASPRATKITELDESAVDDSPDTTFAMKCSLPPHRDVVSFRTYAEYEAHHNRTHTNRCVECGKNFPSEHLLNVHIEECHDAFAAVKREKGEHTYSCFVEGCDRKCRTPQKRRSHLIDKHMYPKNYFFAVTKEGVDGRQSLLLEGGHRRRRSSTATVGSGPKTAVRRQSLQKTEVSKPNPEEPKTQTSKAAAAPVETPDTEMEDLAGAMSALQFVPMSIRFGHRKGKTGFAKQ
ncbi:Component of the SF3b subcomplex of the U2 snRNP [Hypoxylon texense]